MSVSVLQFTPIVCLILSEYLYISFQTYIRLGVRPMNVNDLKVKTSFGNAPLSKNKMETLITNDMEEYVLTNMWSNKFCRETAY